MLKMISRSLAAVNTDDDDDGPAPFLTSKLSSAGSVGGDEISGISKAFHNTNIHRMYLCTFGVYQCYLRQKYSDAMHDVVMMEPSSSRHYLRYQPNPNCSLALGLSEHCLGEALGELQSV